MRPHQTAYSIGKRVNEGRTVRPYLPSGMPSEIQAETNCEIQTKSHRKFKWEYTPHGFLLYPLIPLCGLFLLRTSAIQASLIALGLASVLLSPFSKRDM